jgi:hypothetical protein
MYAPTLVLADGGVMTESAAILINDYPERWTTAKTAAAHEKVRAGTRARLYGNWEAFADSFPSAP